jgi:hypothetical protein
MHVPLWAAQSQGVKYDFRQSLSADWTLTRASNAWVWQGGSLVQIGSNVPAIDQTPDGSPLGIGIWGQITNLFLNSQAPVTQSIATTAQAYTLSFYGTGSIVLSGTSTGTLTGTGALVLASLTFTPTAGTLILTCSGSLSNVQLVAGSVAGPRIITAGSPVTRAADNLVMNPAAFARYVNPAQGTVLVDAMLAAISSSYLCLFSLSDGTVNNRHEAYIAPSTSAPILGRESAGVLAAGTGIPVGTGTAFRHGAKITTAADGAVANGGTVQTISGAMPIGVSQLAIGSSPSGALWNGYIRGLALYTSPMPDAQFQACSNTGAALP